MTITAVSSADEPRPNTGHTWASKLVRPFVDNVGAKRRKPDWPLNDTPQQDEPSPEPPQSR